MHSRSALLRIISRSTRLLVNALKSRDQRRVDRVASLLVEVDDLLTPLGDTLRRKAELLVDLVVRTRSSPRLETELVVRVGAPTEGRVGLDRQDRVAGWENAELVLGALAVLTLATHTKEAIGETHEDFLAWHGDDSDLEALLSELAGSLNTKRNLGTGGDKGQVGVLSILENVTTLGSLLDGRVGELGKVLSGEGENGRGVLGEDGNEVRGGSLVTVGRSPEGDVRGGSEPSSGLNRLVRGSVLTETDRVVGGDLDDSEVRKGGQSDGTGGVGDEVEESSAEWDDTTVRGKTVTDGGHTVLTDTESEVSALVRTETGRWVLEVLGTLVSGQVGSSQIGRTTDELWQNLGKGVDGGLGQLSGSNGGILGGVGRQSLLPSFRETTLDTSGKLGGLLGVLVLVLLE